MSCTTLAERIGKLAAQAGAGIARLDSRAAFVAGTIFGSTTTALITLARGRRPANVGPQPPQSAPKAAPEAGQPKLKSIPKPIPQARPAQPVPRPVPQARPAQPVPKLAPARIPAGLRPQTGGKLEAATIRLANQSGDSAAVRLVQGYRLLRSDGSATGLALAPLAEAKSGQNGWWVTHQAGGQLVAGPFVTKERARELALALSDSPIPWTATSLGPDDLAQAKNIIRRQQELW